ncbi:MAG: glycoside hydrolase family 130 protein [Candidatus Syntrophosphaera sp.]|nr:glycoside hydrolase family 130 protein [Candidatus Syntrophosphaera sp.]
MNRHPANPILTRLDVQSDHPSLRDVSSVFNPGGIRQGDSFTLLLRVQNRARETLLLKAVSTDGVKFTLDSEPLPIRGLERCPQRIFHIYDPRITLLEGVYHVLCAMDTDRGCWLGWFTSPDLDELEYQALVSELDVRNGILFPARFGGEYLRFERPNRVSLPGGVKTGSAIVCSASPDLINWHPVAEVFSGRPHYWDELIGSGPPPIKTRKGWLHIYHGVATHFAGNNIYQAGVSLQDLRQPWQTLARGRYNILEPRELYELTGQVPNVVFPSAAIPIQTDAEGFALPESEVFLYYGAADTCVCLAISTIDQLMEEIHAQ